MFAPGTGDACGVAASVCDNGGLGWLSAGSTTVTVTSVCCVAGLRDRSLRSLPLTMFAISMNGFGVQRSPNPRIEFLGRYRLTSTPNAV